MGTRTTTTSTTTMRTESDAAALKRRLKAVSNRYENQKCCDCDDMKPSWASLLVPPPGAPNDATTLGALCCFHCAGAHRRLGVHICFVRSLTLDDWNEREVDAMEKGGNRIINEAYEAKIMNGTVDSNKAQKPIPSSDLEMRNAFVKKKYCKRKFLDATKFIPAGKEDLFAGFQQSMFDDFPPSEQPLSTTTTTASPKKGDFVFQSGGIDLLVSPTPTKKVPVSMREDSRPAPTSNKILKVPVPTREDSRPAPTSNKILKVPVPTREDSRPAPTSNKILSISSFSGDDDNDSDIISQAEFGNPQPLGVKRNLDGQFGSMKNDDEEGVVYHVDLKGREDDDENNNDINKKKGRNNSSKSPQRPHDRKQSSRRSRSKSARRTRSSKSPRSLSRERTDDNSGDRNGKNTRGRRNHSTSKSPDPSSSKKDISTRSQRRQGREGGRSGNIRRINSLDVDDIKNRSYAVDVEKRPVSCMHLSLDMTTDQNNNGRRVERVRSKATRDDSGHSTRKKDFDNMSIISGTKSEFGGLSGRERNKNRRPRGDNIELRSESGMMDTERKPRHAARSLFGDSSAVNQTTNQEKKRMNRRPSMKGAARRKPPSRSKSSDDIDFENMNGTPPTTAARKKPERRTSSPKRGQLARSKSADDELLLSPMNSTPPPTAARKKPERRTSSPKRGQLARSKSADDELLSPMNSTPTTSATRKKPERRTSSPKRGQLTRSKSADDELLSPMVVQRRKIPSKSILPCTSKM